jgi:hypothetical protein
MGAEQNFNIIFFPMPIDIIRPPLARLDEAGAGHSC